MNFILCGTYAQSYCHQSKGCMRGERDLILKYNCKSPVCENTERDVRVIFLKKCDKVSHHYIQCVRFLWHLDLEWFIPLKKASAKFLHLEFLLTRVEPCVKTKAKKQTKENKTKKTTICRELLSVHS